MNGSGDVIYVKVFHVDFLEDNVGSNKRDKGSQVVNMNR